MPDKNQKSSQESIGFALEYIGESFKEINPWNNFKLLGSNLGKDILAGMVVAVIALPSAIAFGVGSGLGAVAGIWSAIIGGIFGGLFGGSKIGVSGQTGPTMIQLAAIMIGFKTVEGSLDLTTAFSIVFLSGLILVVLSVMRVSQLIYFTPYSVVAGFMCGIGVIVMALQINPFFGLDGVGSVKDAIAQIPYALTHIHVDDFEIALPSLIVLIIWPFLKSKVKFLEKIPAPLLVLLVATAAAQMLHLDLHTVGSIPTGLPALHFPNLTMMEKIFWPALSIAGLVVIDSLLTCIVADNVSGEKHSSDRETFGQGLANMVSSLFGGLPTATSTLRTVTNHQSGGRTPLAAVVHSLVLLALVLGLGPYAEQIPMAALAAILFKVGIDILDYKILKVFHRLPFTDMLVFTVVLIVTLVQDLLVAMAVGLVLAFFRFIQELSYAYQHDAAYLADMVDEVNEYVDRDIKILKPNGPLFFGSVEPLSEVYRNTAAHDFLIIDLDAVSFMDLSGAYAVEDLVAWAENKKRKTVLSGGKPHIVKMLERLNVIDEDRKREYFPQLEEAIAYARVSETISNLDDEAEQTTILRME